MISVILLPMLHEYDESFRLPVLDPDVKDRLFVYGNVTTTLSPTLQVGDLSAYPLAEYGQNHTHPCTKRAYTD